MKHLEGANISVPQKESIRKSVYHTYICLLVNVSMVRMINVVNILKFLLRIRHILIFFLPSLGVANDICILSSPKRADIIRNVFKI